MSSKISNINRLLRVYRDLRVLFYSEDCPSDIHDALKGPYKQVFLLLMRLLSQSGFSIRCN